MRVLLQDGGRSCRRSCLPSGTSTEGCQVPLGKQDLLFGRRTGVALIWAVMILVLLTILTGAVIGQIGASRRLYDRRRQQFQAAWLARAGVELAVARLLTQTAEPMSESVELIENSQLYIETKAEDKSAEIFQVNCEARYPTDNPEPVVVFMSRRFRRMMDKGIARLECMQNPAP